MIPKENLGEVLKSRTILIVDDDVSNRNLMNFFLINLGTKPLLAANGQDALKCFQAQTIDVAFLDMEMPELDGLATKNAIKKLGYSPVFVLCTGNSFESDLSKELGFDYSLEKPIDKDKLRWTLEKIFLIDLHSNCK
jgi:CheY-like chemotaxis protein